MTEPHDKFPEKFSDEWISAYLDGELDPQQRAQVEQLAARDPHCSRLLAELRTLRGTLRTLPRHQLDAGFHERVLRKAQEHMATDAQVTPASPDTRTAARPPARGFLRGLVWAAAVVAAAVLLTVFAPESRREAIRPIALAPSDSPEQPSAASRDDVRAPAELRRSIGRPDGLARRAETAAKSGETETETDPSLAERGRGSEPELGDRYRAKVVAPIDAPIDALADQKMDGAADLGQTRDKAEQLHILERAAVPAPMPSSSETTQAAPETSAKPAQANNWSVAGRPLQPEADALLADAVIHVRWNESDNDQSAEQRLSANLVRNQVAVLRQEPAAMKFPAQPETPARNRSLYIRNQAAVDLGFDVAKPDGELVQLWLVTAPIDQIATAVDQLQQEGGAVLATVSGPRQAGTDQLLGNRRYGPVDAIQLQAGVTATKGASGDAPAAGGLGRLEVEQRPQTDGDALPQVVAEGAEQVPSQAAPSQAAAPAAAEPVPAAEPAPPAPHGEFAEEAAVQRDYYALPIESLRGAQGLASPRALQEQLRNLAPGAAGRPLQVLIVVHGAPAPATAAEAAPAAEPASEAAPSPPQ